ncbi:hypothetical protein [Mycoplasma sp. 2634B]|uniref:hypothetical protein n=1 Tax=Mycoplasma sp. 2634B TaxID=3401692 RepID=UPI003AAF102F
MEKYALLDYETFQNSQDNGDKWVSDLFTYMFSKDTKIPKRSNINLPKDLSLKQIQTVQDNLKFRYPNLSDSFIHFIKTY